MSTKCEYSTQEILEMYQRLDELISQESAFEDMLTKKAKEGKMVFFGSTTELLH